MYYHGKTLGSCVMGLLHSTPLRSWRRAAAAAGPVWDRGLPTLGYLPLAKQRWAPLCSCRLGLGPGRPRARIRMDSWMCADTAVRLFTVCTRRARGRIQYAMELFGARRAQKERLRCQRQRAKGKRQAAAQRYSEERYHTPSHRKKGV